jgi:S1-C subfamily serine protease
VTRIYPGTKAETSGLQVGDVILALDGNDVTARRQEDADVLARMIRQYKIGTEAVFSLWRDGKKIDLTVTLETQPTPAGELPYWEDDKLEFEVREVAFDDRIRLQLAPSAKGVLVASVVRAGWAYLAGLHPDDLVAEVDGKKVTSIDEVRQERDAAAGRALVKRYADTIVSVELVVVVKTGGERGSQSREVKRETNGTMIAGNGLTVTSLSLIDPRAAAGGRAAEGPETEFKEVKLRLADNSEVAAQVILKDSDLDLAFIAPESAAAAAGHTFAFVKLENAADATVLGNYYEITRMPKTLQRTPIVQMSTVVGMIERPRRFVLVTEQTPGCPVFDAQGKVLGLSVYYSSGGRQVANMILPAADVADMANQAMLAKPDAPGKAAAAEVAPAEQPKT